MWVLATSANLSLSCFTLQSVPPPDADETQGVKVEVVTGASMPVMLPAALAAGVLLTTLWVTITEGNFGARTVGISGASKTASAPPTSGAVAKDRGMAAEAEPFGRTKGSSRYTSDSPSVAPT